MRKKRQKTLTVVLSFSLPEVWHLAAHCWTDQNHTITNLICCAGQHDKDWSADYRLYSRDLKQQALFKPNQTQEKKRGHPKSYGKPLPTPEAISGQIDSSKAAGRPGITKNELSRLQKRNKKEFHLTSSATVFGGKIPTGSHKSH